MDQDVLICSRDLEQETDIICLSSDEEQVDHPPQEAIPVVSQPSTADNVLKYLVILAPALLHQSPLMISISQ